MNNKIKLLTSGVLLCIGSNAFAELYISPVVREPSTITFTNDLPAQVKPAYVPATVSAPFVSAAPVQSVSSPAPLAAPVQSVSLPAPSAAPISGVVNPAPLPAPTPVVQTQKSNPLFGKNVPLRIAAANLTPSKSWNANIEEGLDDRLVSWANAANYTEAFAQIERNAGIYVTINPLDATVGIAKTKSMADLLSKRSPNVYVIKSGLSLRKNLEAWAKQANWTVQYQDGLAADYDGLSSATLTVPFEGKGGAADMLLKGTWDKKVPLMGRFKTGNRTLVVSEKGFERVNKLDPKY